MKGTLDSFSFVSYCYVGDVTKAINTSGRTPKLFHNLDTYPKR